MARYTVQFGGRVQGVGFRWTTRRIASRYQVFGWVCNEPDGTVRLLAEGSPDELEGFICEIREVMSENIEAVEIERTDGSGEYDSFEIRR